jgi:hypothetical protein
MIEISGHSDDVVCISETREPAERGKVWEDEVKPNRPILIGTPEAGVVVTMFYAPGKARTWAARVHQTDEGILLPWRVVITNAAPSGFPSPRVYSVLVQIECPVGTPVHCGKLDVAKRAQV